MAIARWNQKGTGGPYHAVDKYDERVTLCGRKIPAGAQVYPDGDEPGCKRCETLWKRNSEIEMNEQRREYGEPEHTVPSGAIEVARG